jgi:probable selenium-dependent hydroxylase accessory protein YqeC
VAKSVTSLVEALGLQGREHLAIVGAGGKTSLMFALAQDVQGAGKRVVTSTTTKVWHREALGAPRVVFLQADPFWNARVKEGLDKNGHVFLAERLLDSGKVQGVNPFVADELYERHDLDYLLVEADGAAGHPVKAPGPHEPVIAGSATGVVAMMGLEAMGRPMGPETVFRLDEFRKLTGIEPGQRLTPAALVSLFLHPEGLFRGAAKSA